MAFYYLFIFTVLALAILDQNLVRWAVLQVQRLELAIEMLAFRVRLEWQIRRDFQDMSKYMRMAEEMRKELGIDEAD
jgi:hypothetical protein